ncbi:MAG: type transport system ATP-binding protein [Streptosporangiaceae bacterium]|jgi:ABC-2 type transport system ATP-binding protein|nr:type transport system ATP-binding protein [Streptosporangiaceae bacterium]
MNVPAIEINALTKDYGSTQARAVDGVSLRVPAGSVFGFLGPNGAGKTTTIKILAGLLSATSGQVRLNGHDVARRRSRAMEQIGAVLEGSRNVYWTLSAWQNLLYFGRLKGMRKAAAQARAEELLTGLELWERRDEKVGDYSRGMQQKVAIAAALIADPPILLLDEPTIGLDVEATRTVKEWVRALSTERGKTVLLTTHQMNVVEEVCDRVAVIRRGQVITDQPTRQLLARFRRRDQYVIEIDGRADGLELPVGSEVVSADDTTTITARLADPQELYGLVDRLRDRGAILQSLAQVQPDLEDVFLDLIKDKADV